MSRWSGRRARRAREATHRERWPRETGRAQVEPLAALVAVFAVGVALSAYAGLLVNEVNEGSSDASDGVLDATMPTPDRNLAEPTVERAERAISETGVAEPASLSDGLRAGPDDYHVNLTLDAAGRTWHAGPTPPPNADTAQLSIGVRLAPGRIRPGRLHAEVWA